jgi:hypothetical protein
MPCTPTSAAVHALFEPEAVSALLSPMEALIEAKCFDFRSEDLRQPETQRRFVLAVDQALLACEPWCLRVPAAIREALVARLLRTCCTQPRSRCAP